MVRWKLEEESSALLTLYGPTPANDSFLVRYYGKWLFSLKQKGQNNTNGIGWHTCKNKLDTSLLSVRLNASDTPDSGTMARSTIEST